MSIINIEPKHKTSFNHLAPHPLQSWEWGEFRKKTGIEVIRLGRYEKGNLVETAQFTIHPIPFTSWTVGYLPKGGVPSLEMMEELIKISKQHNCIFIKLEPNIEREIKILRYEDIKGKNNKSPNILISQFPNIRVSPHPLFTKYTFQLDLNKSEEELLKNMHPKTRYNIKVAQKHGVIVREDNSSEAFERYLELTFETTKRQKFYAHSRKYHQLMWETLKTENGGQKTEDKDRPTAHLLVAKYQPPSESKPLILTTWIVFLFNNILYYPYGASSNNFRNVMASNLMMWEAIRWGKKNGAKLFDMWGALEPNPNPEDPWYGFHRFKQGYGTELVEFIGSFDLVINQNLYRLFNLTHRLRQIFLSIKSHLAL